ncbi:hypothetical protein ACGC1H_006266 [Rhizoctonia solani]|uniref:F-box-like domain protein n=1 Tax=Rhizoctonia solani TaxID=456999 RepID=A0A8H3GZ61_9AGAM|nr:unnamed protein product [Rhizoctonia solani]
MIEELNEANKLLLAALERYQKACSSLFNHSERPLRILLSQAHSDCVSNELSSISAFEASIQQTRATVAQARNLIRSFVPANTLPEEIWGHIFSLVRDMQPCSLREKTRHDLKVARAWYPELLSHVCSRWRRMAISLPTLWTHIDLLPNHPHSTQLYSRGQTFTSRGKNLPLSLHVDEHHDSMLDSYTDLGVFCTPLSARIESLEVVWPHSASYYRSLALRPCLAACKPGVLRELSLTDNFAIYKDIPIDEPAPVIDEPDSINWCLDLPKEFIEKLMAPVEKLSLSGLYFHWASQAYAGLTELRLLPRDRGDVSLTISSSELVQILASSPQLRALHFGIMIHDTEPPSQLVPAQLNHLEILDLRFNTHRAYPKFFPLLSPNTKPLQLSLAFLGTGSPLSSRRIKSFLQYSNITRLYMDGGPLLIIWLPDLLKLLPNLQTLVLTNFDINEDRSKSPETARPPRPRHLETLRLLHCRIGISALKKVTEIYPIRNLILWSCEYQLPDGRFVVDLQGDREAYFVDSASEVRFIDTPPPDPDLIVEEWNPWE